MSIPQYFQQLIHKKYIESAERGLDKQATIKAINDSYPFPSGDGYPYRCWIKARREFFIQKGLSLTKGARIHRRVAMPGQLSLFVEKTSAGRNSL